MQPNIFDNKAILDDMYQIYDSRKNWNVFNHKTIYVTGASGMIASYLVFFFIYLNVFYNANIIIYAVIRNEQKAISKFGVYVDRSYFHIYSEDVSHPVKIECKVDFLVHAASLASPQYYGSNPVETMTPTVVGTNELLKYAMKVNVESMLFFSLGAVYGSVINQKSISESDIGMLDFLTLGNSYSESKRCGEALCHSYYCDYGVTVKMVRIHHTYGLTMDVKNDKRVFSEFVENVVNNGNIVMKSDGSALRAFCYITDTINALLKILLDGSDGEVYNIGNSTEYIS